MARGIDHVVLAVPELEAARDGFARMGFTPTPPARHPFGTGNVLIQLDRCFVELLAMLEPDRIPEPAPGRFSFAAFARDFLRTQEGLCGLVLESRDARQDAEEFKALGLHGYEPVFFERLAGQPDGTQARVAFTLAFASDPRVADICFFTCQQHAPENFWKPDYQHHGNTAETVLGVVLTAPDPAELLPFLSGFSGVREPRAIDGGAALATPRGVIEVLTPAAVRARYGDAAPDSADTPRMVGLRFGVADVEAARNTLHNGAVVYRETPHGLLVPSTAGWGAMLTFEAAGGRNGTVENVSSGARR